MHIIAGGCGGSLAPLADTCPPAELGSSSCAWKASCPLRDGFRTFFGRRETSVPWQRTSFR